MIEFDAVLDRIGHFGRYQLLIVSLVYWLGIPAGLHGLASVFYAPPVDYRCNVAPLDNSTLYPNLTEEDILNYTTPYDGEEYNGCKRYGYDLQSCDGTLSCVNKSVAPINCDDGYHFDTSEFTRTIDTQWGMICDKQTINAAATSMYFVGMWAGAIVFGYMSDRYGRRITMFVANIGTIIFSFVVAYSPWFALFVVGRFFVAATNHGAFLIMCIYAMEISGKYRTPVGINGHTFFALGYMMASLLSYFLRDWRYFYTAIGLSSVPYIFFHFLIPESPRWYFSNGRDEEGKELCYKFARLNRVGLEESVWKSAEIADREDLVRRKYSSLDLFKPARMRLITLNVMFSWFVVSLVYYGLSLNAGNLSGNIWVNNALNGVMEIIGYMIVILTMDRLGRKPLLSGAFLLGGLACIGSMLCELYANGDEAIITTGVVMAFIGKIGAGAAFSIVYNYTAELYPTVIRSNGLGVGSMAARWGSILSPFIILLYDTLPWFPSTLFGVLSLAAGFMALLYPETLGKTMPQTIEEAELFYKGQLEYKFEAEVVEYKNEGFDYEKEEIQTKL